MEVPQGDAGLLAAIRSGNAAAYVGLYERHASAARALARALVHDPAEAEDVVAETFTRMLDLIRRDGGPREAFRVHLLTALRRTVHERSRGGRGGEAEIELFDPGVPFVDPALTGLERSLVARSFLSLSERWQLVLWHVEVEEAGFAEVAPMLGAPADSVEAVSYQALEALRQACLRTHLAETPAEDCRSVLAKMGAYVRGGLAKRESKLVERHVEGCTDCRVVFMELADVSQGMRVIVGPLIAGPALGVYLMALNRGGLAGGFLGTVIGWGREPERRGRFAASAGAVVAFATAVALVLMMVADPVIRGPVTDPTPIPAPIVAQPDPLPEAPPPVPEPRRSAVAIPPPERNTRPARGPAPVPRLVASINALGALVRSEPGMVAVRLRNAGSGQSAEIVARIGLPPGVMLPPAARRGRASAATAPVPMAGAAGGGRPAGTVDGWSCRAVKVGARCFRGPLPPGRSTAVFLRVMVSPRAAEGAPLSVRVSGAGAKVTATSASGVQDAGAPARFATDGRVVTSAIGNTLLAPEGPPAHRRPGGAGRQAGDGPQAPRLLDQDRDPSTGSSSAARLALPARSRIVWAGLYWSGGAPAAGPVKFRVPGKEGYRLVRASRTAEGRLPSGRVYQAFAEVTRLVSRLRGRYWVADVPMGKGPARHAGWSLVVIAADPRRPYSRTVVVDTVTVVDRGSPARIPLDGLTPAAAPARMDLVAWGGAAGVRGDRVKLGRGRALRPVSGGRDPGDAFDGSATGALGTGATLGVDVDGFRALLGGRPVLKVSARRGSVIFGVAVVNVQARS
ncbi:sigma-70 family RNA polymerase sigma factor [Planomonospora sp. ID67723]|uniref:zf-HC2 domain-containing protein n=1 Tax=Planomonospora sp. ID67723 TaxID=2738134 RepID=UPI0018C4079E|nr:sigma-70 family RNA polymerase sigma factor [Planomonospora sp. ID67723]MBG0827206.1 sigma-70 family RNA polymerase sigma factor [Planomonospora sp. ID67723]